MQVFERTKTWLLAKNIYLSLIHIFAPYKQIQGRGDTLNIGMMTYTFTAPAKDILGIHMVNHAGNYVKSPSFELYGDLDKSPERKCEDVYKRQAYCNSSRCLIVNNQYFIHFHFPSF